MIYYVGTKRTGGPIRIFHAKRRDLPAIMELMDEGNPEPLYLLHAIRGGRLREAAIHRRYRAHRIRADWFDGRHVKRPKHRVAYG